MKKPSRDEVLWHERISKKRMRRRLKRRKKAKPDQGVTDTESLASVLNRTPICAPEMITFFPEHADGTIELTGKIRGAMSAGDRVLVDFSSTKLITAAGLVYLYSELHQLLIQYGPKTVIISSLGLGRMVKFHLRESGLLKLVNRQPEPKGRMLPIIAGEDDDHLDEIVRYLILEAVLHKQLGAMKPAEAEKLAGEAIKEAMLNVKYHAYPNSADKRWWVMASIHQAELHIALCDRGVGIPKTLPRKTWFEGLRDQVPLNDDAEMIRAAMEYSRTSDSLAEGRGLGGKDIQQLVLGRGKGHLTIVSGMGHYRLSGESSEETIARIKLDVSGTVIQWSIPLPESTEE